MKEGLTMLYPTGRKVGHRKVWLCECHCGKLFETAYPKRKKSCGCGWIKHGKYMGKDPLEGVLKQLKQRVLNPNNKDFRYYGAKGVGLCEDWQTLHGFKKWAYKAGYVPGLSIDRIDPDGNYEPKNCRWIPLTENIRRKR